MTGIDIFLPIIRTAVPAAVGALLTWLVTTFGVVFSPDTVAEIKAAAVVIGTALFTALWYTVISILSRWFPFLEWLNGAPRVPVKYETAVERKVRIDNGSK